MSKKWQKGVSIIGVGYTPFGNVLERPELKGMTYRELASWAILDALKDAGIDPEDVDSFMIANYQNEPIKSGGIHAVIAEWLGLQKIPSFKFETACASAATGIRIGGSQIASGIDDIVVVASAEVINSVIVEDEHIRKNDAERKPIDPELMFDYLGNGFDLAYFRPISIDLVASLSALPALAYAKKYGVTIDQLDEALSMAAIALRRGAVRNPKSISREEYADIAKRLGFSNVMDYMKSPKYDPFVGWPMRVNHLHAPADGGSAIVLCATENAKKYCKKPVEVAGIGLAAQMPYHTDLLHMPNEEAAFEQAYSMANLDPKEIGYMGLHDWSTHYHIMVPEQAGYIEKGQAWKAIIEGRTAFDGDKPMNTHGGEPSFGNAYSASAFVEIAEAVQQIRGECGLRQVYPQPKTAVVQGYGTGPTVGVTVLKKGW